VITNDNNRHKEGLLPGKTILEYSILNFNKPMCPMHLNLIKHIFGFNYFWKQVLFPPKYVRIWFTCRNIP